VILPRFGNFASYRIIQTSVSSCKLSDNVMKKQKRKSAGDRNAPKGAVPEPSLLASTKSTVNGVLSVKREILQLHVWIVTAVSLLQPIAVGLFDAQGVLPQQPWPFYVAVLKATAPLTITLSLWTMMVVAFWPNDNDSFGYLMLMCLLGGVMLTVAAKVGNAMGGTQVTMIEPLQVFGPVNGLLNALLSYLLAYRGALFVSSLGIAGYAGFICFRVVHMRSATQNEGSAASDDADRRAA
jgi:hypothetical protein